MADYGLKVIAENGNAFILPDYNPFVFSGKYYFKGMPKYDQTPVEIVTNIPGTSRVLPFVHAGNSNETGAITQMEVNPLVVNGVWVFYIRSGYTTSSPSMDFYLYLFADRELNSDSGNYGLRIFDKNGILIYNLESKPLRLRTMEINFSYDPGKVIQPVPISKRIATLPTALGFKVSSTGGVWSVHPYGFTTTTGSWSVCFTTRSIGKSYTGSSESWFYNSKPVVFYIDPAEYD